MRGRELRQLVNRPEQRLRVGDWSVFPELDCDNREITPNGSLVRVSRASVSVGRSG
jgi:hypothetical protein